tara:strand:+ start:1050 stop:1223 length:174 start_codon:yes stop_codon:yes gene_type:complete
MKVSAATSRRLGELKDKLPLKDAVEYAEHCLNGGDRELWLLKYEKKLQGKRLKKEGI